MKKELTILANAYYENQRIIKESLSNIKNHSTKDVIAASKICSRIEYEIENIGNDIDTYVLSHVILKHKSFKDIENISASTYYRHLDSAFDKLTYRLRS